jgi:hypothetical protein
MSTKKYRPYLTLAELKHLHQLSHQQSQISALTRYLGKYISDIESGYRVDNYATRVNPNSMVAKLDLTDPTTDSKTLFDAEQERRYTNNEMSPKEEAEYEKQIGLV